MAEARERIAKLRKTSGTVTIRGPGGKPIPGASVRIEQTRHEFLFGCNFFRFGRINDPEREQEYRRRFAAIFNYATLGFYWMWYEPEKGRPQYAYTDGVVGWSRQNGITCKGHPLVWDYTPDPNWLPDDFNEIKALSNGRVREIVSRFKGRMDVWDVVNEASELGRTKTKMAAWARSIGAVPYVAQHLKIARAANPGATLLVNDYQTDRRFYEILDGLREDGKLLFDAVGIQSHMHGGGWPLANIWKVCDAYAPLGVPIHFTETTIVSGPRKRPGESWQATNPAGEEQQAAYVPEFYTMLFAHPSLQGITWWDFSDDGAWQGAAAGWVRKDMSAKPVYDRMMSLIKGEWWTKADGQTDADGEFKTTAFFGAHKLTVKTPSGRETTREINWERGKPNRFAIEMG